ncbi:MAG TPA: hypothetical protein DD417_17335 [Elusimicrobia bacterium]|nr:hypothetical protein [Elusimicrobiota bacterium]
MLEGKWLVPRNPNREVFEKDYPLFDPSALQVYCPGCRSVVRLGRKSPNGRVGGWCPKCNRGVGA